VQDRHDHVDALGGRWWDEARPEVRLDGPGGKLAKKASRPQNVAKYGSDLHVGSIALALIRHVGATSSEMPRSARLASYRNRRPRCIPPASRVKPGAIKLTSFQLIQAGADYMHTVKRKHRLCLRVGADEPYHCHPNFPTYEDLSTALLATGAEPWADVAAGAPSAPAMAP